MEALLGGFSLFDHESFMTLLLTARDDGHPFIKHIIAGQQCSRSFARIPPDTLQAPQDHASTETCREQAFLLTALYDLRSRLHAGDSSALAEWAVQQSHIFQPFQL
jgi:hypothetical protein